MRQWIVSGYDGEKEFFRQRFDEHSSSENDIKEVMQRLYCKFLTALEIVECTKGYLGRSEALDVQVDETGGFLVGGQNGKHFTAKLLDADQIKQVRKTTFRRPEVSSWETS